MQGMHESPLRSWDVKCSFSEQLVTLCLQPMLPVRKVLREEPLGRGILSMAGSEWSWNDPQCLLCFQHTQQRQLEQRHSISTYTAWLLCQGREPGAGAALVTAGAWKQLQPLGNFLAEIIFNKDILISGFFYQINKNFEDYKGKDTVKISCSPRSLRTQFLKAASPAVWSLLQTP